MLNIKTVLYLSISFIAMLACKNIQDVKQVKDNHVKHDIQEDNITVKDSIPTYITNSGLQITVIDKYINVFKLTSKENIGMNNSIIRYEDENKNCMSDGFLDIAHKDIYFTVEQQNCSGWTFIDEYITFKYIKSKDEIILHKFGLIYTDRRNPNKLIPEKIFTSKEFGMVRFDDANIDSLYLLLQK